jgi:hypothetical protein
MASSDPWTTIHEERRAVGKDLEPLTAEQWATPSLCALVMAMVGRKPALDDLSGEGLATLRERMQ